MPYVPSRKTDGKSTDREEIDVVVEVLAEEIAGKVTDNLSLVRVYVSNFQEVADTLLDLLSGNSVRSGAATQLATVIYEVGKRYDYEGAYLGEFNYAFTRLIQCVPQTKVAKKEWATEIRYWAYGGGIVGSLMKASLYALDHHSGSEHMIAMGGIFMDIKDEYKWKVNRSYEATQIRKSGDAYDTPFRNILVEVVEKDGTSLGYLDVYIECKPGAPIEDVYSKGKLVLE
mgnify:CR=1 FL=1